MNANLIITILYWSLLGLALLAPLLPRRFTWRMPLAILAYLLASHFDRSGPGFASSTTVGVENTVRGLVIPSVLLLFSRPLENLRHLTLRSLAFFAWIAFVGYAAVASLWSPFFISALKLIGYFYGYTAIFLIYLDMIRRDQRGMYQALQAAFWLAFGVAGVQTYLLGNVFGTEEARFTSFSAPQSFAGFVCNLMLLLLFWPGSRWTTRLLVIGAGMGGIMLSGSNTVFMAALLGLGTSALYYLISAPGKGRAGLVFAGLSLVLIVLVGSALMPRGAGEQTNRALRAITAILDPQATLIDLGTFRWRLLIYDYFGEFVADAPDPALLFGHGTSSGAQVMLRVFSRYSADSIDANRVIHNEYLRVLYEMGLIGTFLFALFLGALIIPAVRRLGKANQPFTWSFIAFLPLLLSMLLVENAFAGANGPSGSGIAVMLAAYAAEQLGFAHQTGEQL